MLTKLAFWVLFPVFSLLAVAAPALAEESSAPKPAPTASAPSSAPSLPPQRQGYVANTFGFSPGDHAYVITDDISGSFPLHTVAERFFVDARLSMLVIGGSFQLGTPWLGARYVPQTPKWLSIDLGAQVGIPVPSFGDDSYWYEISEELFYAQGGWDMQRFLPRTLMFRGHLVFDFISKWVLARFIFNPLATLQISSPEPSNRDVIARGRKTTDFYIQHAIELQSQGFMGLGARLQGVVSPTQLSSNDGVPIVAIEPYGYMEWKSFLARVGVMFPFNPIKPEAASPFVSLHLGMRLQ